MNPFLRRSIAAFLGVALFAACPLFGETKAKPQPYQHPLANARLAPALLAVAARDHVDLSRRQFAADASLAGDSLVFWIGAVHDGRSEQWLVQLTRSLATPAELAAHRGKDVTKYLSWGSVVTFHSDVDAIDVWLAGPVAVGEGAKPAAVEAVAVKRMRVFVPRDYLRLGLDDSERVDQHIRRRTAELLKEDPSFNVGHIYALDHPVKPRNVAYAKPVADRIVFTPELERAWMGGYVALQAFYEIVQATPPLRQIAEIAVRKPAPWKLAKMAFGTMFKTNFGGPNAKPISPERVGLLPVGTETFEVPYYFAFGDDAIVSGWMVVTRPIAPLDVGAGILGLVAFHPKDPTRVVEIAAIAASCGTPPPKPPPPASPAPARPPSRPGPTGDASVG